LNVIILSISEEEIAKLVESLGVTNSENKKKFVNVLKGLILLIVKTQ